MNNYFVDAIENLNIEPFIQTVNEDNSCNSIEYIVKKYNQHPSILKIKHVKVHISNFRFRLNH